MPDKAIDLVDEAAARLRMQVDSKPEELDELDRRIMQLKIEKEALKEGDRQGVERPPGKARQGARRARGEIRDAEPALETGEGKARQRAEAERAPRSRPPRVWKRRSAVATWPKRASSPTA